MASSVRGDSFGTTRVTHEYARGVMGDGMRGALGLFEAGKTTA